MLTAALCMASCRSSRQLTEEATHEEATATQVAAREQERVADTVRVWDTLRVVITQRPGEAPDTMASRSTRQERVRERQRERDSVAASRHEVVEKREVLEAEERTAPLCSRKEKVMVAAIVIEGVMLCVTILCNRRKRNRKKTNQQNRQEK